MGRTYRRNPDDYNSYGKSLREKRQRGSTRNNWDNFDAPKRKGKNKDWSTNDDSTSRYNYDSPYDY